MAVITKITAQQKNKDRYNIFMDYGKGEQYAFSVDEEVLIKHRLKKGMEMDELSLIEINYQDDIRKAYNLAVGYLAARIRSEKEIRDYLNKKDIEDPVINEVLHKLTEQKYINDLDFAIAYVRTQMNTNDKGVKVIQTELREKGIKNGFIETSLNEYTLELQIEKAVKLCEKYSKKYTNESKRMLNEKLRSMLMRKGYTNDVIQIAVSELEQEESLDGEMEAVRHQGEKASRKYAKFSGYEYKQKVKQALFRKGFSFELIDRYLDSISEED